MQQQERPLFDRVWEFTKEISVQVSKSAQKHWKINTLRVEITSFKYRINTKYKELGRYMYEALKSNLAEEESYKKSIQQFFEDIKGLEAEIYDRELRIEALELMEDDAEGMDEPHGGGDEAETVTADPVEDDDEDDEEGPQAKAPDQESTKKKAE